MQPVANLGRVGADVVEARQLREALEPEDALEERSRAVADCAARPSRPASAIRPRSRRFATAESAATPRIRAMSGRGTDRDRRRSRASRAPPGRGSAAPGARRAGRMRPLPRARRGRPSRRRRARARCRSAPRRSVPRRARSAASTRSVVVRRRGELLHRQRRRGDDEQRLERPRELVERVVGIRRSGRSMRGPFVSGALLLCEPSDADRRERRSLLDRELAGPAQLEQGEERRRLLDRA